MKSTNIGIELDRETVIKVLRENFSELAEITEDFVITQLWGHFDSLDKEVVKVFAQDKLSLEAETEKRKTLGLPTTV